MSVKEVIANGSVKHHKVAAQTSLMYVIREQFESAAVFFLVLRMYRTIYVGLAQGGIYLPLIWSLCIDPLHF